MKFDTKLEPSGRDSPYPGPHPFDTSDQDFFFGRDAERDALKALWLENHVVVLHGSAGCGKTSLLRAGLTPALRVEGDLLPVGRTTLGSSFPEAALPDHNPYTLAVLSAWSPAESLTRLSRLTLTDFLGKQALVSAWAAGQALDIRDC